MEMILEVRGGGGGGGLKDFSNSFDFLHRLEQKQSTITVISGKTHSVRTQYEVWHGLNSNKNLTYNENCFTVHWYDKESTHKGVS